MEREVVGGRNEVYLKRWTILDPEEFMKWARVFNDRRFARYEEPKRKQEWDKVEEQYKAASKLASVYYVGKYFLGGASAFVALPAQIPSHAIRNTCFLFDAE